MPEAYYAHQALSAWKKIALTHRLNTPVVAAEGPQCMMVSVHGSSVHCDDFKALCGGGQFRIRTALQNG